jgi:hypothetical protein
MVNAAGRSVLILKGAPLERRGEPENRAQRASPRTDLADEGGSRRDGGQNQKVGGESRREEIFSRPLSDFLDPLPTRNRSRREEAVPKGGDVLLCTREGIFDLCCPEHGHRDHDRTRSGGAESNRPIELEPDLVWQAFLTDTSVSLAAPGW